jgi:ribosomal-protein-alanine N-acetyltransferase
MKAELDGARGGAEDFTIEPMTLADVDAVLRIEKRSFTTQWPPDAFRNEIQSNRLAHYFVGRVGDRTVAYGGIWVVMEDAHVTTIAVDPDWRGRGFGELVLLRLIEEAVARGAAWMTLEVRASNAAAQALYRKYGFTVVATRKGYYSDNGEDALVMWAGDLRGDLYQHRLRALREALGG